MIVKLEDRKALMERARELMSVLSLNAFDAIVEAEKEKLEEYEEERRCENEK